METHSAIFDIRFSDQDQTDGVRERWLQADSVANTAQHRNMISYSLSNFADWIGTGAANLIGLSGQIEDCVCMLMNAAERTPCNVGKMQSQDVSFVLCFQSPFEEHTQIETHHVTGENFHPATKMRLFPR